MRRAKDWFPEDKATHEWLNSMKKSSRATYQSAWKYFLEYTGMTGDQILADRKADKKYAWEKRVLDFKRWMIEEKKQAEKTATTAAATARSFFAYHRVSLEFRPTEKRRLKEAKTKYEDYRFSREDLAKMCDVGDPTERYVLTVGKSFGLRAGDFLALARGDLEAYIDREPPISIGEYATEKESVKAYPFIDSDAKPVIKLMLGQMDREGRKSPDERMLTYTDTIQLSRIVRRLTEKAGIKVGNKRVRFHCLRKFLCDRLSDVMSESKWKQVVGKAVDEKAYVSSDLLREDYKRAMSETTFTKIVGEEEVEKRAKKMTLMTIAVNAGLVKDEEEMKAIWRIRKAVTDEEQIKVLEEMTQRKTATNEDCANGHADCQKIVSEEELPNHLSHGWRVAAVLPSGKVVISND